MHRTTTTTITTTCTSRMLISSRFPPSITVARTTISIFNRCYTSNQSHFSEEELQAARTWLTRFTPNSIPRKIGDLSFSRSSGPGGQNVNKVNSKATLRVPLQSIFPLVPKALHPALRSSRFCAAKSDALVIQSDDSRRQSENSEKCFSKLHELLVDTAKSVIPGETSKEQIGKVQKLKKAENEARIRMKKLHSSKKSSRRGNRDD